MLLVLFSGCAKASNSTIFLKFDSNGNYNGFSNLSKKYTAEQAEKDGCYVHVNSEIVGGEQFWKDFIQNASNNKNSSIRIANIYQDETYFIDIFYLDGYYHAFSSGSEDLQDNKFKYLLTLEGTLPNAAKSGTVTILTDDKELTYLDVMWTFLSSDMHYKESISPFKFLFF
jgi:hypothetical protein